MFGLIIAEMDHNLEMVRKHARLCTHFRSFHADMEKGWEKMVQCHLTDINLITNS